MAEPHPDQPPYDPDQITLTLSKSGHLHTITLPSTALLADLITAAEDALHATNPTTTYDWDKAKFIAAGTLLRSGPDDHKPLAPLATRISKKPITLQVPTVDDITSIRLSSDAARAREARRAAQRRAAVPARRTVRRGDEDGGFGFMRIEPLLGLRNPERSREFLVRLAEDVGIKAAMRRHGFTVGLLTEMEPLSNTQSTHEGTTRLLGLNRNHGEVIELRLRTDAGDGYRAYNTIRATLCHELAHNVHGPHDAKFWALCHQIEREVAAASLGRSVGEVEGVFEPSEEEDAPDHRGWTGGTCVLGGTTATAAAAVGGGLDRNDRPQQQQQQGLSRRDVIAQAAEERMRRAAREGGGSGSGSSSGSAPPEDGGGEGNRRTA
ncbi:unnamed protein product [Discula destructiva]